MYGPRETARYQEADILSSSPERLVPLLYEHLLVNLKRGSLQIRRGDVEGKFESLGKASDILFELIAALDHDAGGEIADRLASLYGFWANEISQAGYQLDAARVDRVALMVDDLKESWVEAARSIETRVGAVGPPPGGAA
jgi:flagellar protein FliS